MTLSEYLVAHSESGAAFANRIGITRQAVGRYIRGVRTPSRVTMQAIADATNGAVQPNDFFDLPGADGEAAA